MTMINSSYDPSEGILSINLVHKLIGRYSDTLIKIVEGCNYPGASVDVISGEEAVIYIPVEIKIDESKLVNGKGGLPKKLRDDLRGIIDKFTEESLNQEIKSTEIIPLSGYPLEDLKKDIKSAIAEGRKFCVVNDYDTFLKFNRSQTMNMRQVMFGYLTNDYCNLAIEIETATDLKHLQDKYSPMLENTSWI